MINEKWLYDQTLRGISQDKLEFLQKLIVGSKEVSEKEKMPFLLALASKAKKNNISFSSDETTRIISVLKKYSSPDEHARMDQIMQMYSMFG